ncbi:translation elongation factor-like protein [Candidatus Omnitrophota bacterium]
MIFGFFGKKSKEEKGTLIGKVVHYFPHVKAAVIEIKKGGVSTGDQIRIKGNTTDFEQKIESMQIEHESVDNVSKGQEVAIKVKKKTRRKDKVFLLK